MHGWIRPPVAPAAAAHVLAWAVAAFWMRELSVADDHGNVVAYIALGIPIMLSGLSLVCALERSARTVAWAVAWIMLVPTLLGVASIGMFLMPITGLMFWAAGEIPPDR